MRNESADEDKESAYQRFETKAKAFEQSSARAQPQTFA
jgi:hypothetical protein